MRLRPRDTPGAAGECPSPGGEEPTCHEGNPRGGPGGSHSPDDHEERHCEGLRRDAVDQGLKRAGEGADCPGDHLPAGVEVGERPTGSGGRDAARTRPRSPGEAASPSPAHPRLLVNRDQ